MKHLIFILSFFVFITKAHADITLPAGFSLTIFAEIPGARSLAPAPELGVLFVGSRGRSLYAILDQDQNGQAESTRLLSDNLKVPNGLAWKNGYLYVAEQHRLVRFKVGRHLPTQWPEPEILYENFPDKRWHGWRYAKFGPDGGLYVSIGAPCNICALKGLEGTIVRFETDSWVPVIFAKGVRNSVGFDFDPHNGDLIFTDNGADHMGDDVPPDELNRAQIGGLHFGYPYYGGGLARTDEFKNHRLPANRPPLHKFQAHVAPLGVHFYQAKRFPKRYQNGVFVAQHGSWNRRDPVGYQISFLPFDEKLQVLREENFLTGWLGKNGDVTGRPVDITQWADGRMLISDDARGRVYSVDYQE
ncbi:NHL repeat (fragment) [Candidatus Terasakiella magnetica]|uniref:NHL repeat n=1 Tax=Candidatus Terasakiella magnetica TaxID=1867952 RepID=A0A1C3REM4_9PROT